MSKGNILPLMVGMKVCITTLASIMTVSERIGNQATLGPRIALWHIPKRFLTILQRHLYNYVRSRIICISQNLETTGMSLN